MRRTNTWYLVAGSLLVGIVLFVAFFTDAVTTVSPYYSFQPESVLGGTPPFPPGPGHPLGTDELGRDLWSRVAFGTRWSLFFAALIMGARLAVALPLAMLAVLGPRWVHWLIDRAYLFTNAVPPLLIYIIILASPGFKETGLLPSITATLVLLTFMEWPRIAMVLRGRMEEVLLEPYIEGATAVGATRGRIFWVHMMPHVWPTLIQVMTEELGRGLINIGQLGFFRIWVGGGIQELFDTTGPGPALRTAAGIPEWGTMLGGARNYIASAPWIPLAPALAFLVSITGLNLLSQGLEGALVSMSRLYDSMTPRLRRALAGLAVLAIAVATYWYNGGLPWGKRDGILALVQEQQAALQSRDLDRYAATLLQGNSGNKDGQMSWLDGVPWEKVNAAVITPLSLRVVGRQAYGTWHVDIGFPSDPPIVLTRKLRLVRQNGRWYDTGEAFTTLRGRHTDLSAFYDPNDPTIQAAGARYDVNMVMSVADYAYEDAVAALPWLTSRERVAMWLYSSHLSYEVSVQGLGGALEPGATVWHAPDGGLHISPLLLQSRDRKAIREVLALEFIKYLVGNSKSQVTALPFTLGAKELAGAPQQPYEPLISVLLGHRLYGAEELLTLPVQDVRQERGGVYRSQAALLVQYLQQRLGQAQVDALLAAPPEDPLAALAQAEGLAPAEVAARYEQYLWDRLSARSVLHLEAGRLRIPAELQEAVKAWAEAAAAPDPAAYLAHTTAGNRKEHLARYQALQAAGIRRVEAVVLDATSVGDLKRVTFLDRYTHPDGHTEVAISVREWVQVDGAWLAYTASGAWEPGGRETP